MTSALPDLAAAFAQFEHLAGALLAEGAAGDDGSHDAAHLIRVWRNVGRLQAEEGGDLRLLCAAVLLHDGVAVEKNAPDRANASRLSAEKASSLLAGLGWSASDIAAVAHAILTHSFSAGLPPETLEARILQDADRLDAIGMIGAVRCFYIAGRLGSGLYDPLDPLALDRPLDDKAFALDHFAVKLFKLAAGFQTESGRRLAAEREARLRAIVDMLMQEIG
ncbi:phosphohydrolase [Rhizobium sp. Leaf384]|uniref:HD domain-containing protein n=1 Tax=unclassified Rhizobium TaxID=2613769 RepID=UPI0007162B79|nr:MULTISPECIES: HD domain-containing protein [unclassified Rhizobium]KQS80539.1 phosphohydrolase [Rhizobium sp. Leaf384]KQS86590.1 phosphohydrolase [Rhizobium sp. Leaf383]